MGASPRGPQPRQVIVGKRSSGTLLRIIGILSTEYSFCQVIVHLCPHGRSPILPDLQSWHKCLNPPRPRGRSHVSEGYLYVVQLLKSAPPSRAESANLYKIFNKDLLLLHKTGMNSNRFYMLSNYKHSIYRHDVGANISLTS